MAPGRTRQSLRVSARQFRALVERAIDGIPPDYRRYLENVAIVVEEEPPAEILDDLGMQSPDDLLGLYQGSAVTEESFFSAGGELPARISIYRRPILRMCRTTDEIVREIRDTVVHEIGHHLGLRDDDMPY